MSNPAGWYPQQDGQQRYWDGEQWTDNFAPGAAPTVTPPAVARKNWFLRHKVITAIGAVLLLGMFAGIAGGGTKTITTATVAEPVAVSTTPDQAALDKAAADKAAADKAAGEAAAKEAEANQAALDKAAADQAAADKAAAQKAVAARLAVHKAAAAKAAAAKAAALKAAAPQLGKTVRDGKFAFTVTAVKCGIAQVGTNEYLIQKAQGQYCRASIKVENIGNEAQTMFASNQYLFDTKGRKFSADATANMYDDSAKLMFEEINPGNSATGHIYFDVPTGITLGKLELHDSMFSGGITVRL